MTNTDVVPPIETLSLTLKREIRRVAKEAAAARGKHLAAQIRKRLPGVLYHYTDDKGLKGILESGDLWFTNIRNMNDPSELSHGLQIANQELQQLVPKKAGPSQVLLNDFGQFTQIETQIYTCSLSTDKDELGQWRAYADDGRGFAIGFDAPSLIALDKLITFNVRYDDKLLRKGMRSLVKCALPFLKKHWDADEDTPEHFALGYCLSNLVADFILLSAFHKHEDYAAEKEVRLILKGASRLTPKYRTRPYSLIKYLTYPHRDHHAIKEIIVGPSTNAQSQAFAADCVKAFCKNLVALKNSEIPYRSTR